MTVVDVNTGEVIDRRPVLATPGSPITAQQIAAQCRSVEVWAEHCDSIDELREADNRLAAIAEYLGRTSNDGRNAVAGARLRLEVRVGELLGEATVGAHSSASEGAELTPNQRSAARKLAQHPDIVEDVIAGSDDDSPASRRKAMDEINRAKHARPTDDEVREQDRQADIAAKARQLARFVEAFPLFIGMASHPDRAEILAAMPEAKRLALLDIERGMS